MTTDCIDTLDFADRAADLPRIDTAAVVTALAFILLLPVAELVMMIIKA